VIDILDAFEPQTDKALVTASEGFLQVRASSSICSFFLSLSYRFLCLVFNFVCGIFDLLRVVSLAVEVIATASKKCSNSAIEESVGATTARGFRSITTVLLVHHGMSINRLG
jgi:hypothetical protein